MMCLMLNFIEDWKVIMIAQTLNDKYLGNNGWIKLLGALQSLYKIHQILHIFTEKERQPSESQPVFLFITAI